MQVTIEFEDNAIIHHLLDKNYPVTQQYAHDANMLREGEKGQANTKTCFSTLPY